MSEQSVQSSYIADPFRFAAEGRSLSGTVAVARLVRLADALADDSGTVTFGIVGRLDAERRPQLRLTAQGVLNLRCQRCLGAIDITTRRNGYGRQVESFSADLEIPTLGEPAFRAVCIRAPVIEAVGDGVEVLAELDGRPVLVRQDAITVSTFHPELADDVRLHEHFLDASVRV